MLLTPREEEVSACLWLALGPDVSTGLPLGVNEDSAGSFFAEYCPVVLVNLARDKMVVKIWLEDVTPVGFSLMVVEEALVEIPVSENEGVTFLSVLLCAEDGSLTSFSEDEVKRIGPSLPEDAVVLTRSLEDKDAVVSLIFENEDSPVSSSYPKYEVLFEFFVILDEENSESLFLDEDNIVCNVVCSRVMDNFPLPGWAVELAWFEDDTRVLSPNEVDIVGKMKFEETC